MSIEVFNLIEAGWWFFVALIIAISAYKKGRGSPHFKISVLASVAFLVFGITDLIEVYTGAWWKPFWLLLLKAVCIIVLVACFCRYKKLKR